MAVITTQPESVKAFLDLIAWSEGTSTEPVTKNDGYDVIVTGEDALGQRVHEEIFTDYSEHPFLHRAPMIVRPGPPILESTAAGRYQIILHWWLAYAKRLKLVDFSPLSQDEVALEQMEEQGATAFILNGNVEAAIEACHNIWASFPGNDYGQGGKSMVALLAQYQTILNMESIHASK